MRGFFRKVKAEEAAKNTELLRQQCQASIDDVKSSTGSRTELDVLRKRVAELTHKAMRGGLSEAERVQIMHEADLLWTRLAVETQQTKQAETVS